MSACSSKRRASSAVDEAPAPKRSKKMVASVQDINKITIDLTSEQARAFLQFYASLISGRYSKDALTENGLTLEEVEALEMKKCKIAERPPEELCWANISTNHLRDAFVDNPDWVAANYTLWLKEVRKNISESELKYCKSQASHYWHNERNKINAYILSLLEETLAADHLTGIANDHAYLTTAELGKQWLLQQCRIIMDPKCAVPNKLTPSDALTKHVANKLIAVAGKSLTKAKKALEQFAKRSVSATAEKHGFDEHSSKPKKTAKKNEKKKKKKKKSDTIEESESASESEISSDSDSDADEQEPRLTLTKKK